MKKKTFDEVKVGNLITKSGITKPVLMVMEKDKDFLLVRVLDNAFEASPGFSDLKFRITKEQFVQFNYVVR